MIQFAKLIKNRNRIYFGYFFTKVDALPGAEVQAAIGDGDGDANTAQRGFGMGWHIISTLQRMFVLRTVLTLSNSYSLGRVDASITLLSLVRHFRHETVENRFHIHTNIRVAILVDAQSATGVLREDVHDARLRQFRQLAQYLARHQMEAATFRLQGYFYLLYHNGCKGTNKN